MRIAIVAAVPIATCFIITSSVQATQPPDDEIRLLQTIKKSCKAKPPKLSDAARIASCSAAKPVDEMVRESKVSDRRCAKGVRKACDWSSSINASIHSHYAQAEAALVQPLTEYFSVRSHGRWDPGYDITHPAQIIKNVGREAGSAISQVVPTDVSCVAHATDPNYVGLLVVVENNKTELATYGVHDRESCIKGSHAVAAVALKIHPGLAVGAWEAGRCICPQAY